MERKFEDCAAEPVFIGMEPCGPIDDYSVLIALYRMHNGAIRYVVDAADTVSHEKLRCVANRDFESRMEAAAAGQLHMLKLVRSHQRPDRC